ncbi:hypothetical protein ACOME3_010221 [Neoechinorhynchus agilis]
MFPIAISCLICIVFQTVHCSTTNLNDGENTSITVNMPQSATDPSSSSNSLTWKTNSIDDKNTPTNVNMPKSTNDPTSSTHDQTTSNQKKAAHILNQTNTESRKEEATAASNQVTDAGDTKSNTTVATLESQSETNETTIDNRETLTTQETPKTTEAEKTTTTTKTPVTTTTKAPKTTTTEAEKTTTKTPVTSEPVVVKPYDLTIVTGQTSFADHLVDHDSSIENR